MLVKLQNNISIDTSKDKYLPSLTILVYLFNGLKDLIDSLFYNHFGKPVQFRVFESIFTFFLDDFLLAVSAIIPVIAFTVVSVYTIYTLSIDAGIGTAIIDVDIAVWT